MNKTVASEHRSVLTDMAEIPNVLKICENEQIFTDSAQNALQAKLADLSNFRVREFGYRQFLGNGTTIGFCTRNIDSTKCKNPSYQSLQRFYNQVTGNNLVVYRRTRDKIEGFYFLPASDNSEIIRYYINHFAWFESFISFVSHKVNTMLDSIKYQNLSVKVFSKNSLTELFPESHTN